MDSGGGWRGCLFCYGLFGYGLFISTLHRKILYSVTYSPDRYQDSRRRVAWFCRYVFRWDDAMVDADLSVFHVHSDAVYNPCNGTTFSFILHSIMVSNSNPVLGHF